MQNKLTTPEELRERVSTLSDRIDILENSMSGKSERMKELDEPPYALWELVKVCGYKTKEIKYCSKQ